MTDGRIACNFEPMEGHVAQIAPVRPPVEILVGATQTVPLVH